MGVALYLSGFDIRPIETRHETSDEPSRTPGDDSIASRLLLPVRRDGLSAPMPEGACNRQNKPRTWVSGYNFWDLTSYLSRHVTRRLLVHLDDQETTVSHRGFFLPVHTQVHSVGCETVKIGPSQSVRSYGAGFCIKTIEGHHETSDQPSRTPGGDVNASRSIDTGAPISPEMEV